MPENAAPSLADQLRPLHGPLDLADGPSFPPLLATILVLLLVLAGALLLLRYLRAAPDSSPAAVAERELVRLLGLRLVEQGRVKEHYALLAACLRRYVAAVYGLPASALTPGELAAALGPRAADPALVDYLRRVLGTGDLVRFDHTGKTSEEARADVMGALDAIRAAALPATAAAA